MKILCVFGKYNYGDPQKGCGTEYSAFIPALKNLGHEVELFDSWDRSVFNNFQELNQALLKKVDAWKPRVMLTVQTLFEVWTETLQIIKNRGDVATISWATDDSWKYWECSRFIGRAYHAMTTTYPEFVPQYHADGIPHVLATQWAVTGNNLRAPKLVGPWKYQISFVGSANAYRRKQIADLSDVGIHVDCFGFGWPAGPVEAERIPEIMNDSFISLNFSHSTGINQLKARTFEIPGAGSLLFTEPANHLENFYREPSEIVLFRNFQELIERLRFYQTHPDKRNEATMAAFQRTRDQHTYENRMKEVIPFAIKAQEWYRTRPEAREKVSFQKASKAHRTGYFLECLRKALLGLGNAFFGEKRGPRAARKLVYEISYRLLGAKTYSAAGIPGRLFYHAS